MSPPIDPQVLPRSRQQTVALLPNLSDGKVGGNRRFARPFRFSVNLFTTVKWFEMRTFYFVTFWAHQTAASPTSLQLTPRPQLQTAVNIVGCPEGSKCQLICFTLCRCWRMCKDFNASHYTLTFFLGGGDSAASVFREDVSNGIQSRCLWIKAISSYLQFMQKFIFGWVWLDYGCELSLMILQILQILSDPEVTRIFWTLPRAQIT